VHRLRAALETVAGPQQRAGCDEYHAADPGVDDRDGPGRPGDVTEGDDGHRDEKQQSRQDERERERPAAATDEFEKPLSEPCVLHVSGPTCAPAGVKTRASGPDWSTGEGPARSTAESSSLSQACEGSPSSRASEGSPSSRASEDAPSSQTSEDAPSVVEYCVNNVDSETRERLANTSVEDRGAPCLERCGTCRKTPFLVVDGDLQVGESHAALLAALPEVSP